MLSQCSKRRGGHLRAVMEFGCFLGFRCAPRAMSPAIHSLVASHLDCKGLARTGEIASESGDFLDFIVISR
jgi:hypothetical protein